MLRSVTLPTSPVLELLAPLVGQFGVNMKEGHRKERTILGNGDPSELQRMLVPLSLFDLIKATLACSVLLLCLRPQKL